MSQGPRVKNYIQDLETEGKWAHFWEGPRCSEPLMDTIAELQGAIKEFASFLDKMHAKGSLKGVEKGVDMSVLGAEGDQLIFFEHTKKSKEKGEVVVGYYAIRNINYDDYCDQVGEVVVTYYAIRNINHDDYCDQVGEVVVAYYAIRNINYDDYCDQVGELKGEGRYYCA